MGNSCGRVGGSPAASSRAPLALAASAAMRRSRVSCFAKFTAAADHLAGGLDLAAGQLELELDAVLGGVGGHSLVHGDRFAGRRVGEKELFLDAKGGMAGHGLKH